MSLPPRETLLIERAQVLMEQGRRLHLQSDLAKLDQWDEEVNELLERVNRELTEGLSSTMLKGQLERLISLYGAVIDQITELQLQKDDEEALLLRKRRALFHRTDQGFS